MNEPQVHLFGCGKMGSAYLEVLKDISADVVVRGNSEVGARKCREEFRVPVEPGGWQSWEPPADGREVLAIVAVPVEDLAGCLEHLVRLGVRRILLEKPAGLTREEIERAAEMADSAGADVHVAYNRRFYAATRAAREMIREDGGVSSLHFEFTEIPERVLPNVPNPETRANWYLANSSHVVDLAFHLGGEPVRLEGISTGGLDWHPAGSRFVGHGETEAGALFTYHANWEGPGSWRLELVTPLRKLVFRPMERLSVMVKGSFSEEDPGVDYHLDTTYKPGVYLQTQAFLKHGQELSLLPTLREHAERLDCLLGPLRGEYSAERIKE